LALYTLDEINNEIAEWKAALNAITKGQQYTIGARSLVRADLSEIRTHLEWLETQQSKTTGSNRMYINQGVVAR